MVINTDNPQLLARLRRRIEREVATGVPRVAVATPTLDQAQRRTLLERFGGRYYPAGRRFGLDAWRRCDNRTPTLAGGDSGFFLQRGNRRTPLLWVGGTRFRRATDPVATVILVEAHGKQYLQGELGNFVRLPASSDCRSAIRPPFSEQPSPMSPISPGQRQP